MSSKLKPKSSQKGDTLPTVEDEIRRAIRPIHQLACVLERVGSIRVLAALGSWSLRFSEIRRSLDVTPGTLSARLKELADSGLVTREVIQYIPPHVRYTLTRRGEGLRVALAEALFTTKRQRRSANKRAEDTRKHYAPSRAVAAVSPSNPKVKRAGAGSGRVRRENAEVEESARPQVTYGG